MNNEVIVGDKTFVPLISAAEIEQVVSAVAERLNSDYADKQPMFVVILNGAFMFAADLLKHFRLPCTMSCVKLSSYEGGLSTTGNVRQVMGLRESLEGKDVIIVEDIVDTGTTMHNLIPQLLEKGARSVEVCTFLFKPEALLHEDARPKYVAKEIGNRFIIGYGLDYDEYARNLPEVYVLK